jgi:hypothetical protein
MPLEIHMSSSGAWWGFVLGLLALLTQSCSSGDDDSGSNATQPCSTPVIDGSLPFLGGTGTLHGTGTLPAGSPDGYQLVLLVGSENAAVDVVPTDPYAHTPTCGRGFNYTITRVDVGSGTIVYNLYAPNSNSSNPDYAGTSTNQYTIADGQTVEFDPTF